MSPTTAVHSSKSRVLILWGDPPAVPIVDETGRSLHQQVTITAQNQASFELALRRALMVYFGAHVDISTAKMVRISTANDFANAVKRESFARLVYYGHGLLGENALLPSLGHNIPSARIKKALEKVPLSDFDMLGCETMSLAAELSLAMPGVAFGYLRGWREDNFEVDPTTRRIKALKLDEAELKHYLVKGNR